MWNVMTDSWLRSGRWVHEREVGTAASVSYKGWKKWQLVQHHNKEGYFSASSATFPTRSMVVYSSLLTHRNSNIFSTMTVTFWPFVIRKSNSSVCKKTEKKPHDQRCYGTNQRRWSPADTMICLTSRLMMKSGWSRHSMMVIWCWRASLGSCWTT